MGTEEKTPLSLAECREEIDRIDAELTTLFMRRMQVVEQVAAYKKEHSLPVRDQSREDKVVEMRRAQVPALYKDGIEALYRQLFAVSRALENQKITENEGNKCSTV